MYLSMNNTTTTADILSTTESSYHVYQLDRYAVIGITVGVCVGVPFLVLLCCCFYACISKRRPSIKPDKPSMLDKIVNQAERNRQLQLKRAKMGVVQNQLFIEHDEVKPIKKKSEVETESAFKDRDIVLVQTISDEEAMGKVKKSKKRGKKKDKPQDLGTDSSTADEKKKKKKKKRESKTESSDKTDDKHQKKKKRKKRNKTSKLDDTEDL